MIFINFLRLLLHLQIILSGNMPEKTMAIRPVLSSAAVLDSVSSFYFNSLSASVSKPDYPIFKRAFTGFLDLKAENKIKKNLLTIIDFSRSANQERMWVIDLEKLEVRFLSLVAHGKNSGVEYATHFSNTPSSLQSSLGFYVTGPSFYSELGLSLLLNGVEPGINDKARERGIIMHSAWYVSKEFIRQYGILGRSFGCPAIPVEGHEKLINLISGSSCIYIYYPDPLYQVSSLLNKEETAIKGISVLSKELPGNTE
jgi:hypothetical protein